VLGLFHHAKMDSVIKIKTEDAIFSIVEIKQEDVNKKESVRNDERIKSEIAIKQEVIIE
jgi:hypothetical protein